MCANIVHLESRIDLLFHKFFEEHHQTLIDEHLQKLLSHLSKKRDPENDCSPTLKLFEGWLKITIAAWSNTKVVPLSNVGSFILNCTSLLSKREERFCNLNSNNFFIKLINVVKARQSGATPTLKTAYIKLLSSLLEHRSGVEFMIACNFWEDVYQWSLSKESDQIAFESTQFISKLLERTVDFDEDFCDHVVKRLLLALGHNIYKSFKAATEYDISDEVASMYVEPTLKLIDNILDHFLEGICLYGKDFRVLLVFLTNFQKEEKISDFMLIAQIKCLDFYVGKITFIMEFLQLYTKTKKSSVAVNISESVSKIQTSFIASLSKANCTDYTKCCSFGLLYWKLVESKFPAVQTKKTPLSHQLVTMILVPNLVLDIKSSHLTMQELEETYLASDTIRDSFAHKLLKSMDQDLIRIFYTWREHVTDPNTLLTVCIEGAIWAKRSCRYFCKEQAVLMFTSLIYILKDMLSHMKNSSETREVFLKRSQYFAHIFDLLAKITEEFHLRWKDSWAANEVVDLCFEYLMVPGWPTDLLVQVLRMINIGIAMCMSPNLALLVDGAKDSTIGLLGPLLYSKLKDAAEVREAALEVVSTVACMSSDKFPSLQKVLMDSELPTLVVKMSTCDGESFVRATAIKCLQEMIQVEEIWNNALQTEDLPQKMRDVLLNETEGIVRVEAATFMCVAYEHQQFQKENLDRIYETMIYSSTTDLHWEVKIRALSFWDKVIKNHLQNQGMIDDSFPNVTFSKEHRKIVTLTDSEIRKRLLKVLSQLSAIGCLGVLMSAIKDDCDMEVSKTAVKITQRLVDLFRKYNVRSDSSVPTSPSPTENGMSGTVSMSSGISVDENMDSPASNNHDLNEEILEQIVNSKDVALLKNVYVASDYGSVSNYDIQVRKIVTPNEFLQFTQQDLNNIITEKKNWLNGIEDLGSLLDDMLKTYDDDVNNMDCY